ncbi:hypothetical protein AUC69_08205 [Methyloceanibacter superfactus]|jgi:hypothetical protein|uniref:Uncharacterized protein n=1 Tax=Methyloceanibacter superfactus TaxID=1774969 RepID=A0A1E3W1D3_9HYPH|nr:hypothetical protein [Methyloceanibacter superfactus]ODR99607.1 hypothetical protein AUC69_08205 [Methyloceanibacter superfactus]
MDTCTSISAIQLLAAAFGFLLVVLSLDMFWVRANDPNDIHGALRKRGWLNAFVAMGGVGAAALLWVWVNVCTNGAF